MMGQSLLLKLIRQLPPKHQQMHALDATRLIRTEEGRDVGVVSYDLCHLQPGCRDGHRRTLVLSEGKPFGL